MPRLWVVLSFALALGISTPSQASVAPDLSALVQLADARNPQIQAARAALARAKSDSVAAGLWAPPMLQAGIMNIVGLAGPSISVSQAIPGGDKLSLAQRAALLDAEAAAQDVAMTRLDVESKLVAAYYDEAAIARVEAVYQEVHARLNELVHVAAAKYSTGEGIRQDVVSAQFKVAQLLSDLAGIEQQREDALSRLNALADRPSDEPVHLVTELPAGAKAPDEAAFVLRAAAYNPGLLALAARRDAARARYTLATRERAVPDIDLSVQAGRSMPGDMPYFGGMVGLQLPWFAERKLGAQAAQAQHALEASEAEYQAQQVALKQQVRDLSDRLARIDTQRKLLKQGLAPLAGESFQAAIAAYQVNKLPFESVLAAQNALFETELQDATLAAERLGVLAEMRALAGESPLEVRTL